LPKDGSISKVAMLRGSKEELEAGRKKKKIKKKE
jgi:hypothetical protein